MSTIRRSLLLIGLTACQPRQEPTYVFLWARDSAGTASDFLAVIDATPGSAHNGAGVPADCNGPA